MLTRDVRPTCPTCGTVDVRAGHVTILPCIEVHEGVYRFCCPKCTNRIVRNANPSVVMLLLRAGAYPAQLDESLAGVQGLQVPRRRLNRLAADETLVGLSAAAIRI